MNKKFNELLKKHKLEEVFGNDKKSFQKLQNTLSELEKFNNILLLPCSLRYDDEFPKSTILALLINEYLSETSSLINVSKLNILPCTGNVSRKDGNSCGIKAASLQDPIKNPSGNIRCWQSYEHKEDELWQIANKIFDADAVIFFASIRWGQANAVYQNLIERLTWLENRHTTLGHDNLLDGKHTGMICIGQNWNGEEVLNTQKKVHEFFGFNPNNKLYWNWQYTKEIQDESKESYKKSYDTFKNDFKIFIA